MFEHPFHESITKRANFISNEYPLWSGKRCPVLGKPLSFTRYVIYSDRLIIENGLITYRQEELRLYRVLDVSLRQTLFQRIFSVGTIAISSADATTPRLLLQDIKTPKKVMTLLSNAAERERNRYRIGMVEGLSGWFPMS